MNFVTFSGAYKSCVTRCHQRNLADLSHYLSIALPKLLGLQDARAHTHTHRKELAFLFSLLILQTKEPERGPEGSMKGSSLMRWCLEIPDSQGPADPY